MHHKLSGDTGVCGVLFPCKRTVLMTKHLAILGTIRMTNLDTLLQCTTEEKPYWSAKLALPFLKKEEEKKKKSLEPTKTCF